MDINNPHDKLIRETLSDKETAAEFLKTALPEEITGLLEWDSLNYEDTAFISEILDEYHSDMLFSCEMKNNEPLQIYILFEHKSSPGKKTPLQLLQYLTCIYTNQEKLSPVIPLVYYHGKKKWNVPVSFFDCFRNTENHAFLRKYTPDFHYALYDLDGIDVEHLATSLSLKAVLYIMKNIRNMDTTDELERFIRFIRDLFYSESALKVVEKLLLYLYANKEVEPKQLKKTIEYITTLEEGDIAMTTAERLRQEGIEKGIENGSRMKAIETAKALLQKNMSIDDIADVTGLSIKEVKKLRDE